MIKANRVGDKKPKDEGLVGFYGFTFVTDEHDKKVPKYSFQIIGALPPDRWVVEYFSAVDGLRTNLAVYLESFLLGDDVRLYASQETFYEADQKLWLRQSAKRRDDIKPLAS
jgi:hypothetical protein